ncbi:MAG: tetratricopeptide repeat protein [Planctomycetia bacterium]|nr:tetratricopeptide repeat protein [Planctomycetia bacterium]
MIRLSVPGRAPSASNRHAGTAGVAAGRCACRVVVSGVALLIAATAGPALAQSTDRVVATDGTFTGKITAVTPNEVQIEDRAGEIRRVAVDRIRDVQFAGEPQSLRSARGMLSRGRAAEALEEIAKVEAAELDGAEPTVLADMDYVKAVAAGRVALVTGADPRDAGRLVNDFLQKHPESHHLYDVQELLGDLLARAGRADNALAAYSQMAKGPPAFKVRAAAAKARMLLDQQKHREALAEFDAALAVDAGDEASGAQKRAAALGRARSLIGLGRHDDAIGVVTTVIDQSDPEEGDALAAAYDTLGVAYRSAGRDQDALIAFLTVDLVYNGSPEAHAEALWNLVELWERARNPERAREARATLDASYPGSRWAKQAAGKSS